MHKLTRLVTVTGMAALIGAASPVWAESAPVFDVDSFESAGAEQSQDLPMPPAPGEEGAVTHPAPATASVAPGVSDAAVVPQQAQAEAEAKPIVTETVETAAAAVPAPAGPGVSVSTANMSPDQRMRRLEQQLSNLQNSQSAAHVESLQNEVQTLRGQIETLNHQIDKMQTQQKAAAAAPAVDQSKTLADSTPAAAADTEALPTVVPVSKKSKKSLATKALPGTGLDATKDQPNVAEEQKIYQTAYDYIKAKKYTEAVTALQEMLKKYPSGQFASNAHYWLGELYGLMGKNDNALEEFTTVISKFPGSPRVSDAQLKVGLILAAQSKWPDAKKAFKTVINTYPGTASSRLASEQLKQIKTAGH